MDKTPEKLIQMSVAKISDPELAIINAKKFPSRI